MKKIFLPLILLIIFLTPQVILAQQDSLRAQIVQIAKQSKGIVGVSLLGLENFTSIKFSWFLNLFWLSRIRYMHRSCRSLNSLKV